MFRKHCLLFIREESIEASLCTMDASECKAARLFRLEYVSYGFVAHATSTNLCAVNFNSSLFSSDKMTARAPHRLAHAFSKFPFAWPSTMDAHKPTNAICASEEEHAIVAHAKLEFISGIPKPSPPSTSLAHSSAESASSLIFTSWGVSRREDDFLLQRSSAQTGE